MRRVADGATPARPAANLSPADVHRHPLAALQRAAGNQAVAGLISTVQRCGGEVHPGCSCAEEAEEAEDRPAATARTRLVVRQAAETGPRSVSSGAGRLAAHRA